MKKLLTIVITVMILIILSISYRNYPFLNKTDEQPEKMGTPESTLDIKAKRPEESADAEPEQALEDDSDEEYVQTIDAQLYFLDREKDKLVAEEQQVELITDKLEEFYIINNLIAGPKSQSLESVISDQTEIIDIEKNEDLITVDLSSDFLDSEDLLIARATLVNTLTNIEGIKYVRIYIEGAELTSNGKKDGIALGLLSRYPNDLDEIIAMDAKLEQHSNIRKVAFELYFVDCQSAYLLPEVRDITVISNKYARSIVEELLRGPSSKGEGLYPIFPKGVRLLDIGLIEEDGDEGNGLELYFSEEFKELGAGSAQELTTLGSLVYSLTGLPNIDWIKIYYQNDEGEFVDTPIGNMTLSTRLVKEDFKNLLGRKIKIYFSDKEIKNLKPEYRAIEKGELGVAKQIIYELAEGPIREDEHEGIIPDEVPLDRIKVSMNGEVAVIDLPSEFYEIQSKNDKGIISLYAIVNSLTDPINTDNIEKVLFLMDGKRVDRYFDTVLSEPFVRNPALIEE